MSLAHDYKLASIYRHPSSVAERAPPPKETPIQALRRTQNAERDSMVARHQREFEALKDKHNEARNNDPIYRNGMGVHNYVVEREEAEHTKLREKNAKQRRDLHDRHAKTFNQLLEKVGVTPP